MSTTPELPSPPASSSSSSCSICDTNKTCSVEAAIGKASDCLEKTTHNIQSTIEHSLVPVTTLAEEISHPYVDRISHYVEDNVIALSIGAMLGSFITTGIGLGLLSVSSNIVPTLYKWITCKWEQQKHRKLIENGDKNYNVTSNLSIKKASPSTIIKGGGNGRVAHLHVTCRFGNHDIDGKQEENEIQSCIDRLTTELSSRHLTWEHHVQRMAIYIATQSSTVTTNSGPISSSKIHDILYNKIKIKMNPNLIFCCYVVQLEDRHDDMLIEVVAAK